MCHWPAPVILPVFALDLTGNPSHGDGVVIGVISKYGPYQLVLSGPHLNLRLGGACRERVAFGGPQVYGDQRGNGRAGLPQEIVAAVAAEEGAGDPLDDPPELGAAALPKGTFDGQAVIVTGVTRNGLNTVPKLMPSSSSVPSLSSPSESSSSSTSPSSSSSVSPKQ